MNNNGKILLPILWVLLVAASATAYFFILTRENEKLEAINGEVADKSDLLAYMELGEGKGQIQQTWEKLTICAETLDSFAYKQSEISDVTFSISQLATQLGLREYKSEHRKNSQFQKRKSERKVVPVYLNLTFASQFNEFAQFLNQLEGFKPAVFIDKFTIRQNARNDRDKSVDMVLVFFVSEEQTRAKIAKQFAQAESLMGSKRGRK